MASNDTLWVSKVTQYVVSWTQAVNDFIFRGVNPNYATSTGLVNNPVVTLPAPSLVASLLAGESFEFKMNLANTSSVTLSIVGTTTLTGAVQLNGAALTGGEMALNATQRVTYDGAAFQLISNSAAPPAIPSLVSGQCRFQIVSTTSCKLIPWNGSTIKIAGTNYQIPSAGISIANTGLTASTLYYVYCFNNSGTLTLEASATAYAVDATAGNVGTVIKSGDASRTLVGMVYMGAGTPGTFISSAVWQGVRSWFNDPGMAGNTGLASNKSTTSATYAKLDSTTDITFAVWATELVSAWCVGIVQANGSATYGITVGFDGTTPEDAQPQFNNVNFGSNLYSAMSVTTPRRALTEGAHTVSILGATSANTLLVGGGSAPGSSAVTSRSTFGVSSGGVNP